ncbi:tyrosine-type recombinase/integrase [Ruegeria arenilitoris]|uniref:tyrosine-type recombinase/integrase n=1 Tax=Ruegeria arenilitoris TaxID=1173585 RepID=UPI00147C98E8|nr:hypothetical protein [Ruegeria arenilitoris]
MAKIDLSNESKRNALPQRTSYYSHHLGSKCYVLLRVGKRGSTWGARVPGQGDVSLGPVDSLTFDQVAATVRKMASDGPEQVETAKATIGDALDAYERACEITKGTRPMATIRSHLKQMKGLRSHPISRTRLATLNKWRDELVEPGRGIVTVNKIRGTLVAALSAYGVDGEWQKLRKLKEPEKPVDEQAAMFEPEQVRSILSHLGEGDFHDFVKGLWLTGARPGELRAAKRTALRGKVLTLSGKTGRRDIVLTPGVAAFLAARLEKAKTHLFEIDGKPISSDMYLRRWEDLPDDLTGGATAYALRHGFITLALYRNVPIFAVASHCGTSPEMIQQTYGHVIAHLQAKAFGALEGDLL